MSVVYISQQAVDDLKNIFTALINWEKGPLELDMPCNILMTLKPDVFRWQTKHTMLELLFPPINFMEKWF